MIVLYRSEREMGGGWGVGGRGGLSISLEIQYLTFSCVEGNIMARSVWLGLLFDNMKLLPVLFSGQGGQQQVGIREFFP